METRSGWALHRSQLVLLCSSGDDPLDADIRPIHVRGALEFLSHMLHISVLQGCRRKRNPIRTRDSKTFKVKISKYKPNVRVLCPIHLGGGGPNKHFKNKPCSFRMCGQTTSPCPLGPNSNNHPQEEFDKT